MNESFSIIDYFFKFFNNNQVLLLTITGWITVFIAGIQIAKIQLRNNVRLEIYKELHNFKTSLDDSSISLGTMLSEFSLPFNNMKWAESNIQKNGTKNPNMIWLDRNKLLCDTVSIFSENSQRFLNATFKWNSVLRKLKSTRDILSSELHAIINELWEYSNFLIGQSIKEYDWHKWDQDKIKHETVKIRDRFDVVGGFLTDYMDSVHDELIYPIFNVKNIPREDFNYTKSVESKTLTEKGIKLKKYKPMSGALIHKEKRKERKEQ